MRMPATELVKQKYFRKSSHPRTDTSHRARRAYGHPADEIVVQIMPGKHARAQALCTLDARLQPDHNAVLILRNSPEI